MEQHKRWDPESGVEQHQQRWDPESRMSGTAAEVGPKEWSGTAAEVGPRERSRTASAEVGLGEWSE